MKREETAWEAQQMDKERRMLLMRERNALVAEVRAEMEAEDTSSKTQDKDKFKGSSSKAVTTANERDEIYKSPRDNADSSSVHDVSTTQQRVPQPAGSAGRSRVPRGSGGLETVKEEGESERESDSPGTMFAASPSNSEDTDSVAGTSDGNVGTPSHEQF